MNTDIVIYNEVFEVTSQETLDEASLFLKEIAKQIKEVKQATEPLIKEAYQHHKNMKAEQKKQLEPLQLIDKEMRKRINSWLTAQENIRQEQLTEAIKIEQESAKALKKQLIEEGKPEEAARVYAEPVEIEPVKPDNLTTIKDITVEVTDISAFVDEIMKGKFPINLLKVDMAGLKRYIKNCDIKQAGGLKINEVVNVRVK